MSSYNDPDQIRLASLGFVAKTAATATDASGSTDIFSVDGGLVFLLGLFGHVTTVLVADTDLDVDFDPDDGGTDVVLSTIVVADSDPTGTLYALNSTAGGTLLEDTDVSYNALLATPIVLTTGDLKITGAGGGAGGGAIVWYAVWLPIDQNAVLTVA